MRVSLAPDFSAGRPQAIRHHGRVVIVLSPNPAYRLREQWVRLWRRNRSSATWIGLNIAAFLAVSWLLPAVLLVSGGLLAAQEDQPAYLLAGGLLTAMAVPIGRKLWRWGHDVLLTVATSMVEQRQPTPDQKPPLLTRMEGRTLRETLTVLEAVRDKVALGGANRDTYPMRIAAERWQTATQSVPSRVSLRGVQERIGVVSSVLHGAANASAPEDIIVHAEVAEIVLGEVEQAFRRALRREQMGASASMWTQTYEQLEREDGEQHAGRPVALKRWLDQYWRENPDPDLRLGLRSGQ